MNKKKIVYIMGYGRSGSTILDIILSQHEECLSLGALANYFWWVKDGHVCACGERLDLCEYWKPITESFFKKFDRDRIEQLIGTQLSAESISSFFLSFVRPGASKRLEDYCNQTGTLLSLNFAKSEAQYIIDSSKTSRAFLYRPVALGKMKNYEVKVIYLVRDGRGVSWSSMKRTGSDERLRSTENRLVNFLRASLSWSLINVLSVLLIKTQIQRECIMKIHYEDLCSNPAEVLSRLGKFLDLEMKPVINKLKNGEPLHPSHNLGGNRIRFNDSLVFSPDFTWHDELPKFYQVLFPIIAWPGILAIKFV